MHRCLTAWDLIWLAFGSVVGSEIFVIIGQGARTDVGLTIILVYAALLSALFYTECSVDVSVAGGSFSFLRIEIGDFIAFLAAGNILVEAVVGAADPSRLCVAMSSTRNTSTPNWLSSIVTTFVIVFIIVVGFVHSKASNLTPFLPMRMKGMFNAGVCGCALVLYRLRHGDNYG
ncbi:hypothetical protein AHAS_Ahas06G0202300 [Arachis hypogaea]